MRLRVARAVLRTIVDRAGRDPEYLKEIQTKPVEVLVREGLPYDLIEDFLREAEAQAEVSGYSLPGCANTCALTTVAAYPEGFSLSG